MCAFLGGKHAARDIVEQFSVLLRTDPGLRAHFNDSQSAASSIEFLVDAFQQRCCDTTPPDQAAYAVRHKPPIETHRGAAAATTARSRSTSGAEERRFITHCVFEDALCWLYMSVEDRASNKEGPRFLSHVLVEVFERERMGIVAHGLPPPVFGSPEMPCDGWDDDDSLTDGESATATLSGAASTVRSLAASTASQHTRLALEALAEEDWEDDADEEEQEGEGRARAGRGV